MLVMKAALNHLSLEKQALINEPTACCPILASIKNVTLICTNNIIKKHLKLSLFVSKNSSNSYL